jgi:hypothetical protein
MTSPGRFPRPSLARAADNLRAARAALLTGHPDRREHLRCQLTLRTALRSYVGALELQGLPVASKLRHELRLLESLDEHRPFL